MVVHLVATPQFLDQVSGHVHFLLKTNEKWEVRSEFQGHNVNKGGFFFQTLMLWL